MSVNADRGRHAAVEAAEQRVESHLYALAPIAVIALVSRNVGRRGRVVDSGPAFEAVCIAEHFYERGFRTTRARAGAAADPVFTAHDRRVVDELADRLAFLCARYEPPVAGHEIVVVVAAFEPEVRLDAIDRAFSVERLLAAVLDRLDVLRPPPVVRHLRVGRGDAAAGAPVRRVVVLDRDAVPAAGLVPYRPDHLGGAQAVRLVREGKRRFTGGQTATARLGLGAKRLARLLAVVDRLAGHEGRPFLLVLGLGRGAGGEALAGGRLFRLVLVHGLETVGHVAHQHRVRRILGIRVERALVREHDHGRYLRVGGRDDVAAPFEVDHVEKRAPVGVLVRGRLLPRKCAKTRLLHVAVLRQPRPRGGLRLVWRHLAGRRRE